MTAADWTQEERAALVEHYAERGPAWVAARVGRSERAVRTKAEQLGIVTDRSAETLYRRTLAGLIRDADEHGGRPSPVRVAARLGMARVMVERRLSEARKRGDLPHSGRSLGSTLRADEGQDEPAEPTPDEVVEIEARMAEERGRKEARPARWVVPVFATPRKGGRP